MILNSLKKTIGIGSTSILIFIAGIIFSFSFPNKICLGDSILEYLGLKSWSNGSTGIHYTIFYSLIFFICSFIVGHKFKDNVGAYLGKSLSLIILGIILLSLLFMAII